MGKRVGLDYDASGDGGTGKLLDQLDHTPRSSTRTINGVETLDKTIEYQKGGIIAKALGELPNTSAFISAPEALGGPFVVFRACIVPSAVARTIVRRPGNVEAIARLETDAKDRHHGVVPPGAQFNLGGAVHDFGELAFNSEKYLSSRATTEPWSDAKWFLDAAQQKSLGTAIDRELNYLPFGNLAQDAGFSQAVFGG